MDFVEIRARFSGLTSLALAAVLLGLPVVPEQYFFIYVASLIVFIADAIVKLFHIEQLREPVSALYSLAVGASLFTYFRIFGEPFSQIVGFLFVLDAISKVLPGDQRIFGLPEYLFRHYLSAITTALLGLGIVFGVTVFNNHLISVLLGALIFVDGIIKLEYARLL